MPPAGPLCKSYKLAGCNGPGSVLEINKCHSNSDTDPWSIAWIDTREVPAGIVLLTWDQWALDTG